VVIVIRFVLSVVIWMVRVQEDELQWCGCYCSVFVMALIWALPSCLTEFAIGPLTRVFPTRGEVGVHPHRNAGLVTRFHLLGWLEYIVLIAIVVNQRDNLADPVWWSSAQTLSLVAVYCIVISALMFAKFVLFWGLWLPLCLVSEL